MPALVQVNFMRRYVFLQKLTFFLSSLIKLSLDRRLAAHKCTYQLVKMLFQSLRRLPRQMGSGGSQKRSRAVAISQEQSGAMGSSV
jgi:hypothetical protein